MFLAPATACLAVAIYTKLDILKQYWLPILVGCTAGSAASMGSVYGMCRLFGLDESMTVSLLPISDPVAAGLAIGSCSHAVGTSKAIEIGEVEGAMSGLAIGICGIITVLFSMLII